MEIAVFVLDQVVCILNILYKYLIFNIKIFPGDRIPVPEWLQNWYEMECEDISFGLFSSRMVRFFYIYET